MSVTPPHQAGPLTDPLAEADRILQALEDEGIVARLIGGAAIQLRAGDRVPPACRRRVKDIDLITPAKHRKQLAGRLAQLGYRPDEAFNALHGHRRLLLFDDANKRQLDVFVESFQMCHDLPLADRMTLEPLTLPLVELLMTKLQIVKLNPKDLGDLAVMLVAHEVAETDGDAINGRYLARLTALDWGLHHTFALNLARLATAASELELAEDERHRLRRSVDRLTALMADEQKSRRWKLRARVGERVRWYAEPEEVEEALSE